jgi:uncharacterized protein (DUF1015 family)
MAIIRPFAGIRYSTKLGKDISKLIAPPYDVLDAKGKAALVAKDAHNVVSIDLPHVPPKQLGPPSAYEAAAKAMNDWLASGVLAKAPRQAVYPYEQTYTHAGKTYHRRGLICLVKLTPFGVDVIPHEKTYAGPIEDRLHLMHSTGAQLSPVFGLFMDPRDEIMKKVFGAVTQPMCEATLDGVRNRMWEIIDGELENHLQLDFRDKKIYIADGHHRYTTALHYQKQLEEKNGGPLPPDHPANYCMFVLVNGEDPGLLILPTHRLVGGLKNWNVHSFLKLIEPDFEITATPFGGELVDELANTLSGYGKNSIGLYDGATKKVFVIRLKNDGVMKALEPEKSDAWRSLDVAILQRAIFDNVIAHHFTDGSEPVRGYTADENEVAPRIDRGEFQVAFILQSTPIRALAELGKVGEVMPQKSTYFFPKLATGMVINPLR